MIEDNVEIGDGTRIGAHVFVGNGSVIGEGSRIYPHVTIREHSRLGLRVIVHSGAVIGGDGFGFELQNGRHVKIPQTGIVQIDDDVEIRRELDRGPRPLRPNAHRRGHEDRQPRDDRAQRDDWSALHPGCAGGRFRQHANWAGM